MNKEYQEYLKSTDWFIKRKKKLNRNGGTKKRCAICGSQQSLNIHHLNYKNLIDVQQSDLRILCQNCHKITHQLLKFGKIKFKNDNHHSRFAIIKNKVKAYLGISKHNLFNKSDGLPKRLAE